MAAEKRRPQDDKAVAVGQVLKDARERSGISQVRLSELSGVPQWELSRLEGQQRQSVRFETVARLAAGLDISLDEIARECGFGSASGTGAAARRSALPKVAAEAREMRRQIQGLIKHVDTVISISSPAQGKRKR